ncbi:ArsA family ATPase [Halocatena salina]|uniref:Arsenical pump-driving ATPase GET3 n=1 Tax=Halocatena salina TaxID=2934340 RepID=A0A8U0A850_9EURY|nr:TRC40/GET3/ArsA family transport-energizing ATPase [Halocatena salina]UPM44213.1 arsenical pump-driving ATPase GET3 [Halocatena salina]
MNYVFYGGKGGVGKTTCAAATGLTLAERGTETLVISTDPAHSLSDSFEMDVSVEPTSIREHLQAVEIDPEQRRDVYQSMVSALVDEFRDVGIRLDENEIEALFSAGIAPGSDEVAALDLLINYVDTDEWETIVLDTAPTGHTLRLLDLPAVMDSTLDTVLSVREQVRRKADSARQLMLGPAYYALGNRAGDEEPPDITSLQDRMKRVDDILHDDERTEFRVVLVPETMAVRETERLVDQLRTFDIPVKTLVVNKVLENINENCDQCHTRRQTQQKTIRAVQERFSELEIQQLPRIDGEVHGLATLEPIADRIRLRT